MAKATDKKSRHARGPNARKAREILERMRARHRSEAKTLTPEREEEIIASVKRFRNAYWEAKFAAHAGR